jgi:hypothetical protein
MEAGATMQRSRGLRVLDRLAAAFLLTLLAIGSLALWIGIPAGSMYLASEMTDRSATHFLLALFMTIAGMVAFGALLFWINGLYLRVSGAIRPATAEELEEEDERRPQVRGPLEVMLVGSLVVAIVLLFLWFFLLAENPSPQVI